MSDIVMVNQSPKISIILPSLNVKEFISECIESVINQTFKDIEIICVDAGSIDGTLDILEEYANADSRIVIINSDKKSYGYQMNLGISQANGEYIGIVETDDFVDEKMFEILYEQTDNGSADISKSNFYHYYGYCDYRIDGTKNNIPSDFFTVYDSPNILNGHPSIWAAIYKKSFLESNNIKFMEAPGGGWVDNPFLFETFINAEKIKYINAPFYYYRELNPNSSSNNLNDLTLPFTRMMDVLDIIDKFHIIDESILNALYFRIFWHIKDILERCNYEIQDEEVYSSIQLLLSRLNEQIVINNFDFETQSLYYKYLSPLKMIESLNGEYICDKNDYDSILKENNYLYSRINDLQQKNKNLSSINKKIKSSNAKLKSKNNKLKNNLQEIKSSKSFKFGSRIASPVRKVRKFKHNFNQSKKTRILFMPSDNNRTSGAFLSMANLIVNLRKKYPVEIFVILPMKGHGVEVLDSFNINYSLIESEDWVIPMSIEKDSIYYQKLRKKEMKNKKAISKISKFISKNKIDLVHINTTYSYVGAKAALMENVPFVWHLREFLEEGQNLTLWDREYGNNLINKANKVITVSDSLYKKYENIIDSNKLVMIYNGIEAKKFYKPAKTIMNDKIIKFIFVGGFEYHKGQLEFIKACVKLYESGFHNFEVNFVGTGNVLVRKEVEDIINSSEMDNVNFLGYKKDVENYFEKMDISFTCGSIESFGRTTVEAMLSGNLVIGGNVAGTKELINPGVTGLLYNHGDVDDLYDKMKQAITNIDQSKKMADAGRKFMIENMTAEINADNVYKVYEEILNI